MPSTIKRRRSQCCAFLFQLCFLFLGCTAQNTCFTTKEELSDAISQYMQDKTDTSTVALKYGHPMGNWCVSQITDFSRLFYQQGGFNEDLLGWDTSLVTNMESMFENCVSFYGQIQNWNVASVTSFRRMFFQANRFTGDLSQWDTSSAQDMSFMFYNAPSIITDLSKWNVAKVTTFESFASAAGTLTTDISAWDISGATNFQDMFGRGSGMDKNLCAWGNKMNKRANVENIFGSRDFTASNCPDPFDPNFDISPPGPFCHSCSSQEERPATSAPGEATVELPPPTNDGGTSSENGSNGGATIFEDSGYATSGSGQHLCQFFALSSITNILAMYLIYW